MADNVVISGDYKNYTVVSVFSSVEIVQNPFSSKSKRINLSKHTIAEFEVITEESTKSGTSAVLRAGTGAFLLGPVGLLAGLSAKNKGTYLVAIIFKDGKRSLLQINDKIYKALISIMF